MMLLLLPGIVLWVPAIFFMIGVFLAGVSIGIVMFVGVALAWDVSIGYNSVHGDYEVVLWTVIYLAFYLGVQLSTIAWIEFYTGDDRWHRYELAHRYALSGDYCWDGEAHRSGLLLFRSEHIELRHLFVILAWFF